MGASKMKIDYELLDMLNNEFYHSKVKLDRDHINKYLKAFDLESVLEESDFKCLEKLSVALIGHLARFSTYYHPNSEIQEMVRKAIQ